jgi:hypothetical protein
MQMLFLHFLCWQILFVLHQSFLRLLWRFFQLFFPLRQFEFPNLHFLRKVQNDFLLSADLTLQLFNVVFLTAHIAECDLQFSHISVQTVHNLLILFVDLPQTVLFVFQGFLQSAEFLCLVARRFQFALQ